MYVPEEKAHVEKLHQNLQLLEHLLIPHQLLLGLVPCLLTVAAVVATAAAVVTVVVAAAGHLLLFQTTSIKEK